MITNCFWEDVKILRNFAVATITVIAATKTIAGEFLMLASGKCSDS